MIRWYQSCGTMLELLDIVQAALLSIVKGFMEVHVQWFGGLSVVLLGMVHNARWAQGHQTIF